MDETMNSNINNNVNPVTVEQRTKLFAAIAATQAGVSAAVKDSNNPHFKSKYADLANVIEAIKPAMAANGLAVVQVPTLRNDQGANYLVLETTIMHKDGGFVAIPPLALPLVKNDPQGVGSATTYARRYSLSALFMVPAEDDDGNAASEVGPSRGAPSRVESFGRRA